MAFPSRRAYFRVTYPLTERPSFEAEEVVYEVIDCSEFGLHFETTNHRVPRPQVGSEMRGTVQFRRGESMDIAGKVLRTQTGTVVLILDGPGLTFAGIIAEQRYLRSKGYTLLE